MEPLGFHEARHTFASLMIAADVNVKAISTYMGHASVKITLDRYGHLFPNARWRPRRGSTLISRGPVVGQFWASPHL